MPCSSRVVQKEEPVALHWVLASFGCMRQLLGQQLAEHGARNASVGKENGMIKNIAPFI